MPILGAALRAELTDAVGLKDAQREIRSRLRALTQQIKRLRQSLRGLQRNETARSSTKSDSKPPISAAQIRALRARFGDTRKAFAVRAGVSPSIIFLWETGQSSPKRSSTVARLQELMSGRETVAPSDPSAGASPKRAAVKISPKRRATLKLQGQYMSILRNLRPQQKVQVKATKATKGFPAAIALAKKLAQ